MKIISGLLIVRNINEKLCNQFLYLKKNIAKATKQLLANIKLRKIKPRVTKDRNLDKIGNIITIFKIQRNKVDKIDQS